MTNIPKILITRSTLIWLTKQRLKGESFADFKQLKVVSHATVARRFRTGYGMWMGNAFVGFRSGILEYADDRS